MRVHLCFSSFMHAFQALLIHGNEQKPAKILVPVKDEGEGGGDKKVGCTYYCSFCLMYAVHFVYNGGNGSRMELTRDCFDRSILNVADVNRTRRILNRQLFIHSSSSRYQAEFVAVG